MTVNYATSNGSAAAGSDYVAHSGVVTFPSGTTTQTIIVQVIGDGVKEPNETFYLTLSNAVGATIADGQGVGTIVNDDGGKPPKGMRRPKQPLRLPTPHSWLGRTRPQKQRSHRRKKANSGLPSRRAERNPALYCTCGGRQYEVDCTRPRGCQFRVGAARRRTPQCFSPRLYRA